MSKATQSSAKRNTIRFFLLIVLSMMVSIPLQSQSSEGTEFWFGYMEHFDLDQNVKVVMITSNRSTQGIVRIPHHNWEKHFEVKAHDITIITLPRLTEHHGSEQIDSKAIQLLSDDPVSVYIHQYFGMRSEATTVLPVNALGQSYYVMSYEGVNIQGTNYPSEFLIVGVKDETNIAITYSDETLAGRQKGETEYIRLHAGESYQVQGRHGRSDLTGTQIEGDQAFAVFGGARWTEVPNGCGFRDNLLEQMYPISTWGKRFVTIPNQKVKYDVFRLLASEDDTEVVVYGSQNRSYHLDQGAFAEFRLSEASYIQSNRPILVAQYNIGQNCNGHHVGDPSMLLLNTIEQTRDTVTLYNSNFQNITENYISIAAATEDMAFTYFDGKPLLELAEVISIGPEKDYSYVSLEVSAGSHTIISDGCGLIATAYGYGNLESYAYGGGASFRKINRNPIPVGGCLSEEIRFDAELPPSRFSFEWDLGDGTQSDQASFTHQYDQLGSYPVSLVLHDHCLNSIDTVYRQVEVSLRQAVQVGQEIHICPGDDIQLEATDLAGAEYKWTGPNYFFSDKQHPLLSNASQKHAGAYSVVGIIDGCATHPASTEVVVQELPQPDLGRDSIICPKEGVQRLEPGNFHSYLWQDGSSSPSLRPEAAGSYAVTVTDHLGCVGSGSIQLHRRCPTRIYVPNAFSPNGDGVNEDFGPLGQDFTNLHFSIYNRWGTLLHSSRSMDQPWDGRFKGQLVPQGVYVWQLQIEGFDEDGQPYSEIRNGSVTVLR
ncbi:MAG: gliding motility-associated C-terminal domain-containing protein [Bacteroidota bacterium]